MIVSEEGEDSGNGGDDGGGNDDDVGTDDDDAVDDDAVDDDTVDDDTEDDDDNDDTDDDDDDDYERTSLLSEDFEGATFPPEGWDVKFTNPGGDVYNWYHYNNSAWSYEGDYCAITYILGAAETASNELLYTKDVELSGYDSYEVTFWNLGLFWYELGSYEPPELSLEISYDATNWSKIWSINQNDWTKIEDYYYNWDEAFWQERINLDNYSGDTIKIGWRNKFTPDGQTNAFAWSIDKIDVWGLDEK